MDAITDRNILDIQIAKEYRDKILKNGFNSLTEEEKITWLSGLKACLNYIDLNRIETNCKTLSDLFGLGLTTKTDWTATNVFSARLEDYERIRSNVILLRATNYVYTTTPSVPVLPLNRYDKINDIEKNLIDIYTVYNANAVALIYMNDEIYINEEIGVI